MSIWPGIEQHIAKARGLPFRLAQQRSVGGGCINNAYVIEGGGQQFFVKTNSEDQLAMFEAEAEGLREISAAQTILAPLPVCFGVSGNQAYLVLEYFSLGDGNSAAHTRLGEQLAAMHRHTHEQFGWHRDNTIGSTMQINTRERDWLVFWQEYRLGFQLELARQNGANPRLCDMGQQLMQRMDGFFSDYLPVASLLHGDLWSGNYAFTVEGEPMVFDPAVYFGDRETDLAMTELFGGFSHHFYNAYHANWPLDSGYKVRRTFYNLYHILNHFNIFGGGYASQAEAMLSRLLAELG